MGTKEIQINRDQLQLLNAFPSPVAVIDCNGDIITTNDEWNQNKERIRYLHALTENGNFFEHCRDAAEQGSDDALKLIIGMRRILDGDIHKFYSTYISFLNEENEWYKLNIRAFGEELALLFAE
jgi:hypothetical protein